MKLAAQLTYDTVRFDQDTNAHLVVSVSAPDSPAETTKRPVVCMVPLIDISASMAGPKLEYAKRSLLKLIEHLSPNDYCGLVAFDSAVETLSAPVLCTAEAKAGLKHRIHALAVRGATNIGDALLEGLRLANNMDLPSGVITRVILFTDGAANRGPVIEPEGLLALLGANIGGATVSAFGYGVDAQQGFLSDLARRGSGNYSFVQNPDDALTAFGKELGGLLSTYATSLVVDVTPLAGHEIVQVVTDVDAEEQKSGQVQLKVSDVLCGETRNFVFSVNLKAQKGAFPRAVNVFDVKAGFDTLDDNLHRQRSVLDERARVQFVKPGEEQTLPSAVLDPIVGLAQVVRAQIEAEERAKRGEFQGACDLMSSVSEAVKSRGLQDVGRFAGSIGGRYSSREAYSAGASYLASARSVATRGLGGVYDASVDISDLGLTTSNVVQSQYVQNFVADTVVPGTGQPSVSVTGTEIPSLVQDALVKLGEETGKERRKIRQKKTERW